MDEKTKELIAIGASIAGHCQPCFKNHIEQALKLGVSLEEINTAIAVGRTVEKGALKAMDNFAKVQMATLDSNGEIDLNSDCGCLELNCCLSEIE